MEELLELTRQNNAMLKRICDYLDRIESPQYRDSEDMRNMAINLTADSIIELLGNRRSDNGNRQIFFR